MIPLLLIQIGNGGAAAPHLSEGLQYTANWSRLHYTCSFGRLHYDA